MELALVQKTKKKLVFDILDEGHTFCNALKDELWNDSHVKVAAYNIDHPLIGKPRFIVETDGADPIKTLTEAAKRLKKEIKSFEKEYKKIKK